MPEASDPTQRDNAPVPTQLANAQRVLDPLTDGGVGIPVARRMEFDNRMRRLLTHEYLPLGLGEHQQEE